MGARAVVQLFQLLLELIIGALGVTAAAVMGYRLYTSNSRKHKVEDAKTEVPMKQTWANPLFLNGKSQIINFQVLIPQW
ncbi:MAG: hypothetical protein MRQ09_05800 [Candidatus Midichloria sp.]|nr:hypothetical protein [Candidatus Midichloria sp.]